MEVEARKERAREAERRKGAEGAGRVEREVGLTRIGVGLGLGLIAV